MAYEWNDAKAAANKRKHDVDFDLVLEFNWTTAFVTPDERADYGEARWLALGLIGLRLYSLAFTIRMERIRVISLRTASRKERMLYEQTQGR